MGGALRRLVVEYKLNNIYDFINLFLGGVVVVRGFPTLAPSGLFGGRLDHHTSICIFLNPG